MHAYCYYIYCLPGHTAAATDVEAAREQGVDAADQAGAGCQGQARRRLSRGRLRHALVGWLLEHTDTLLKVTIVRRTNGGETSMMLLRAYKENKHKNFVTFAFYLKKN